MTKTEAVARAEDYYDSGSADEFYKNIWGGEDIHIGLYATPDEAIPEASRRTVETMAAELVGINANSRVLDLGAGYGGSGRYLARTYGCEVVCLNLSETQNDRNRMLNAEQGLDHLVSVVYGDFENPGMEDASFDYIWSQDAILHSGDRPLVMDQVNRLLKPGGLFVFTDPMQSDDCPDGVLQPILDRIQLSTLGSFRFYRQELEKRGFEEVKVQDLTHQLRNHYNRVREELLKNREAAVGFSGETYVTNMDKGLQHWVNGADKGYLAWGIINFRKT
ncbi:MAG: methyltransferase domain-containing protein [Beijerinckiaceae bacterium]|jgi:cyclopropane fatty-acyl-phospholipid synthase-like methyltransferase|nr:methyltransferase domain-containing protein [Beijerinckiaceae bacterium]